MIKQIEDFLESEKVISLKNLLEKDEKVQKKLENLLVLNEVKNPKSNLEKVLFGIYYQNKNDYKNMKHYYKSVKNFCFDKLLLSIIYGKFGIYYDDKQNYDKAINYYLKSLKLININKENIFLYNKLGLLYEEKK